MLQSRENHAGPHAWELRSSTVGGEEIEPGRPRGVRGLLATPRPKTTIFNENEGSRALCDG